MYKMLFCLYFVSIRKKKRCSSKSSDPSGVSVKSAKSMEPPPVFSDGPVTSVTPLV